MNNSSTATEEETRVNNEIAEKVKIYQQDVNELGIKVANLNSGGKYTSSQVYKELLEEKRRLDAMGVLLREIIAIEQTFRESISK